MKCKDVEKLLTSYHDGELSPKERSAFERHLAKCHDCQAKLEELEALDELVRDGEAERVPDPGLHYWSSFALRVTRRISQPHTHLIHRPQRLRLFSWRLLPYLSAGVAIVLALIIVVPLLKQSPTKFTAKDLSKPEQAGIKVEQGQVESKAPTTPPQTLAKDEEQAARRFEATEVEVNKAFGGEAPTVSTNRVGAPSGEGTLTEEASASEETPASTDISRAKSGPTTSGTGQAREALKAAPAQTEESEGLVGGLRGQPGRTGEVFYVSDGLAAKPATATEDERNAAIRGTLKVVIDSVGRLTDVGIEQSSGNPRFDSLAIVRYKTENKDKTFRQRREVLYIPFTPAGD